MSFIHHSKLAIYQRFFFSKSSQMIFRKRPPEIMRFAWVKYDGALSAVQILKSYNNFYLNKHVSLLK